ncbi:unnamed protein product [Zymoseptoria tritici ST99CH_1A5]|uniref:Uncharacterized protein n=1 Tax=Zymoseptoria tritici ST99CH_1A5 TaxID=1276529 RepID=A0A1Y6LNX9_ZYMTR|nr:unnamed protein product [Zymoseptoria tritici ST99CH_1A5]
MNRIARDASPADASAQPLHPQNRAGAEDHGDLDLSKDDVRPLCNHRPCPSCNKPWPKQPNHPPQTPPKLTKDDTITPAAPVHGPITRPPAAETSPGSPQFSPLQPDLDGTAIGRPESTPAQPIDVPPIQPVLIDQAALVKLPLLVFPHVNRADTELIRLTWLEVLRDITRRYDQNDNEQMDARRMLRELTALLAGYSSNAGANTDDSRTGFDTDRMELVEQLVKHARKMWRLNFGGASDEAGASDDGSSDDQDDDSSDDSSDDSEDNPSPDNNAVLPPTGPLSRAIIDAEPRSARQQVYVSPLLSTELSDQVRQYLHPDGLPYVRGFMVRVWLSVSSRFQRWLRAHVGQEVDLARMRDELVELASWYPERLVTNTLSIGEIQVFETNRAALIEGLVRTARLSWSERQVSG